MPEPRRCPYAKHVGRPWPEVVERDRPYAEWLVSMDGPHTLPEEDYDEIMDLLEDGDHAE
jgi:hypothetical protein